MAKSLKDVIEDLIRHHGSISVAQYMALCLGHPEFGYYTTKEPFGASGDFTTAPEISQLFGEITAIWIATTWEQLGKPKDIQLIEIGPGRGTWMKDILRGLKNLPDLKDIQVHLVEFSPRLQEIQKETLKGSNVTWHENLKTVPQQKSIIIANEFFDALPIDQAIYHNGEWYQRTVISDEDDLLFALGRPLQGIYVQRPIDGGIFEYAPMATDIMDRLCGFLKQNGGAFLTFDYGDDTPLDERIGETLQAIHNKAPSNPLEYPGESDVTSHVSFASLKLIANEHNLIASITSQREFLTQYGIRLRAEKLLANANDEQKQQINAALHRLVDPNEMGDLFKVMQVVA